MMYGELIAVVIIVIIITTTIIITIIITTIIITIIIIKDQTFCYASFSSNKARILLIVLGSVSHKAPRL
jgi:hypothetical protein